MKYMGWSWDQYCSTPVDLVNDIIHQINEESQAQQNAIDKMRGE